MKGNTTKPTDGCENEETTENEEEITEEDVTELELETLNTQLDQLNSALDMLEQKNDDIQAQLKLLLQSNRAERQKITETQRQPPTSN